MKIEHLLPYLPYDLMAIDYFDGHKLLREVYTHNVMTFIEVDTKAKILLRPLSQIEEYFKPLFETDKEVRTFLSEEFLNNYKIEMRELEFINPDYIPYGTVKLLIKHHFDVFGLIDKGFATDLNTIKQ